MKTLAADERPRERLLRHGGRPLSDTELLAVILRTGRPGRPVLDVARDVLGCSGGLQGLVNQTATTLLRLPLGPAQASSVLATVEIARRIARYSLPNRISLDHPAKVARYLSLRYLSRSQEVMGGLFLDTRNRLLGESELYRGTISRAAVEPRAILKEALLRDAAGFVLFHTHPSGDPSPSVEDLAFTRRLADSGELLGIHLVDHLIIASCQHWVSLRKHDSCWR